MAARVDLLTCGFKHCVVAKSTFLDLDTALFVRVVDHAGLTFGGSVCSFSGVELLASAAKSVFGAKARAAISVMRIIDHRNRMLLDNRAARCVAKTQSGQATHL